MLADGVKCFKAMWIHEHRCINLLSLFSSFQTAGQLNAEYRARIQSQNYSYNSYAAFTYDAAWSVALMLNKSIPLLREKNRTLETMTYRDGVRANIMRDILSRTDFWGMSVYTFKLLNSSRSSSVIRARLLYERSLKWIKRII